jgi:GntR family transcriptional regulator, transcriptional repressor for pyruvate dehydrogenase complex
VVVMTRDAAYRPKKTAMLVAERLVTEIAEKELVPGTPLPPEREMLSTYGVARGSLREALRLLEIQGVITIKAGPGGGPVVNAPASSHLARTLAIHMQLNRTRFRDVLEARALLEPILAAHAAEQITAARLAELKEMTARMRDSVDDAERFLADNERFHVLIAQAAGNHVFALVMASLNWIFDATQIGVSYSRDARSSICDAHERIVAAIESRDSTLAAASMTMHIAEMEKYLARFYPAAASTIIRWDQLR